MNRKIHILDCTLRDGGYANDWRFGDKTASEIVRLNALSGVDYLELAFIRNCKYEPDKLEYSDMSQVGAVFRPSREKLALMVEIGYGYPVTAFPPRSSNTVDLVRVVVWKRMIAESVEYAKALIDKGYEVAIQATRIEQYDQAELAAFVEKFASVGLRAFYIVDTFGLLTKDRLLEYAQTVDACLQTGAYLGYHAHNNMQQAFSNVTALCERSWRHELILDASVMGIGRGAGNLCLELFEQYLNERFCGRYDLEPLYRCASDFIQPIYDLSPWGYSVPYFLSAKYGCNPTYVPYLASKRLTFPQMKMVFERMRDESVGVRFSPDDCARIIRAVIGDNKR